jgi:hypothetical protein
MALKGQRRQAASQLSEEARINRIARTVPLATPQPTDGLTSQAQELARQLDSLQARGQQIAAIFHVDAHAVWEEMLARSRGQRR